MNDLAWDVVIVGAGAAGLMAAIHAGERGRRALLLEKNRKPGVKILMSGGTRCNITHDTDNRGIVAAYGPPGRFLHSALAAFSVQDAIAFFENEGVATKIEETGKIFPVSNRAVDVLDALLHRLERSGAVLSLGEPVCDIRYVKYSESDTLADASAFGSLLTGGEGDHNASAFGLPLTGRGGGGAGFTITTSARTLTTPHLLLTTGGQSYPGSGTTGDGYRWLEALGHTIVSPRPALVPITVAEAWVKELRGVTLSHVAVRIIEEKKVLASRTGSLLFAHFGLSGPVILDVSRVVSGHAHPGRLQLILDFLPGMQESELDEFLRRESLASGKKHLAGLLSTHLPRRLCEALLVQVGMPADRTAAALSREQRTKLVQACKGTGLKIAGTLGFGKAEVTAGGVALDEVDSRTMQGKKIPGLFLAGEILDLDGPIGGYNFQAAWSTGWLAGRNA